MEAEAVHMYSVRYIYIHFQFTIQYKNDVIAEDKKIICSQNYINLVDNSNEHYQAFK